jgi:hypothetical protein
MSRLPKLNLIDRIVDRFKDLSINELCFIKKNYFFDELHLTFLEVIIAGVFLEKRFTYFQ